MNPLFNGNIANLFQQFQQFKQTFKGDPKQQIQRMLNTGQITQQQYNEAVQLANQLKGLLK